MSRVILTAVIRCPVSSLRLNLRTARVHNQINRLDCSQFSTSTCVRDRLYSKKHEWISVDGKVGTVGISDYAQEALGDVVFVQLPDVGVEVNQGDEIATVESVKAASEAYTPVSGRVVEINAKLEEKPGLVNTSCYTEGWLFKLECTRPEELSDLMKEEEYQTYLKSVKD